MPHTARQLRILASAALRVSSPSMRPPLVRRPRSHPQRSMTPPSEPRLVPLPFAGVGRPPRAVLLPHLRRPEVYLSGAADAPPMPVVLELLARNLPLSGAWLPFTDMLTGSDATLRAGAP